MKDEIILTIKLTRNENGTIAQGYEIKGEGFHFFEIIGMMEIVKKSLIESSIKTGKEIPKDKKVRLKFDKP